MMGDTYGVVKEQSVREWRVSNAQMILRLEMLARGFFDVHSGEQMGSAWFVLNRTVDKIDEGGGEGEIDFDTPDEHKAALEIQTRFRDKKAGKKAELNELTEEQ